MPAETEAAPPAIDEQHPVPVPPSTDAVSESDSFHPHEYGDAGAAPPNGAADPEAAGASAADVLAPSEEAELAATDHDEHVHEEPAPPQPIYAFTHVVAARADYYTYDSLVQGGPPVGCLDPGAGVVCVGTTPEGYAVLQAPDGAQYFVSASALVPADVPTPPAPEPSPPDGVEPTPEPAPAGPTPPLNKDSPDSFCQSSSSAFEPVGSPPPPVSGVGANGDYAKAGTDVNVNGNGADLAVGDGGGDDSGGFARYFGGSGDSSFF